MNRLDALYRDAGDTASFARGYLSYVCEVLSAIDTHAVSAFIDELIAARDANRRIYFIGNGGSAATASHFVNDIVIGSRTWTRPFRAVSLADNVSVMTAIANDHGYDNVFTYQLRGQLHPGDLVVAISVSGNSANIVTAVEYAKECGARVVGLTGFDGGRLGEIADVVVHAPTNPGEYGPAEDAHMVIDHLVGAFLIQAHGEA